MADVKISFKIGNIEFVGEGEKEFIGEQLDKIISNAPKLVKLIPEFPIVPTSDQEEVKVEMGEDPNIAAKTLPAYLKEKNATTNQVKKFLATAVWIESKGKNRLATSDISSALKDANQTRLRNASDCLAKNVSKGFIEKDGKVFFVTTDGKESL